MSASLAVVGMGAWAPTVGAAGCVLRVQVVGGLVFNVPVGTPLSSLIPAGLKVLGVSEVCSGGPTSTTTTTTTTTSSSSSSGSTSTSSVPTPSRPSSSQK